MTAQPCTWKVGDHVYSRTHGRVGTIRDIWHQVDWVCIRLPEKGTLVFAGIDEVEWLAPATVVEQLHDSEMEYSLSAAQLDFFRDMAA